MTKQEVTELQDQYEPIAKQDLKLKIFLNRESGEAVMIVFNPNVLGITQLRDFLTLKADHLRNLQFWFKTRDKQELNKMLAFWCERKSLVLVSPVSGIEATLPKENCVVLQSLVDTAFENAVVMDNKETGMKGIALNGIDYEDQVRLRTMTEKEKTNEPAI